MAAEATKPTRSRSELIKSAQDYQSRLKAADASDSILPSSSAVPEKDPTEKGQVGAKDHPEGDDAKKLLVPDGSRPTSQETDTGFTSFNPGPSGTDPVSAKDGDAEDAQFTSTTTPLSKCSSEDLQKIASKTAPILQRMAALSSTLSGGEGAAVSKEAADKVAGKAAPEQKKEAGAQPEAGKIGDTHIKIASALLSTERGIQLVEGYLAEMEGVRDARNMIEKAANDQAEFQKLAAHVQNMINAQEAAFGQQVKEVGDLFKSASEEDQRRLVKLANEHAKNLAELPPELHGFYKAGAADAAMVVQAMMAGEEPGIPGGAGDLDPAQILGLVEQMVQAGDLDPQTAELIFASLTSGEGAPPAEGGEGGAPPEEMPKAASLADTLIAEVTG